MIEEKSPEYNPFDNPKDRKEVFDFDKVFNDSQIDLKEKLSHPPVAIAIGEHDYKGNNYPTPFGSYGDISCIVGSSKSKKTFFKSAIIAGYIGGNSNSHFKAIHGIDSQQKYVIGDIHIHARMSFIRVIQ